MTARSLALNPVGTRRQQTLISEPVCRHRQLPSAISAHTYARRSHCCVRTAQSQWVPAVKFEDDSVLLISYQYAIQCTLTTSQSFPTPATQRTSSGFSEES